MTGNLIKRPRLYVDQELHLGAEVSLAEAQAHYLKNVMRCAAGEAVRLFNGRQGEWLAELAFPGKKTALALVQNSLLPQSAPRRAVHLVFAPIKKARMDWLVEKAVELGAGALRPVLTQNTDVRAVNEDRLRAQAIEAAEQCERLDIPEISPLVTLDTLLKDWDPALPLAACLERVEAPFLTRGVPDSGPLGLLIGPEGGFTAEEKARLAAAPFVMPVSLGPRILRAETAVCAALSLLLTREERGLP